MSQYFCFQVICEEEVDLRNTQEEADTKVFMCANHVASTTPVCIHTVDSDIVIYALYFIWLLEPKIYVKIGSKDRKRVIDIRAIAEMLGELCCKALPALHAFTGNDYTSAFHSVEKSKAPCYKAVVCVT